MTSLTPLQLSLEPMVPGLSAPDTLTARRNDPSCHSVMVVNALRAATPFADWEVITPAIPEAAIPPPAPAGAVPVLPVPAPAAAPVSAAAPPFVRIRARWLERWANLCGRQASDYKLVPFASRALSMGKANTVLDCAAVIGGLDLTKVYTEDEFDVACLRSSVQCALDPRSLISLVDTYAVEPVVLVGGSLRSLVIRMGQFILTSSLTDGLPDSKALALFKFALGGGHLASIRDAAGSVFFRVLRCVHAVSMSRGPVYQAMAALAVGTEADAGSVVADS